MAGFVYSFQKLSVLIVDDTEYMLSLLTTILKALNFGTVLSATNGQDAKRILEENRPMAEARDDLVVDIIISDWRMSPGDGADLLHWIRHHKSDSIKFLPFIMLTGYTEHARIIKARDLGMTEFLRKPVTVNSLVGRIGSVIERPRPFVSAPSFFGPDRRRQSLPFEGADRRKAKDG